MGKLTKKIIALLLILIIFPTIFGLGGFLDGDFILGVKRGMGIDLALVLVIIVIIIFNKLILPDEYSK